MSEQTSKIYHFDDSDVEMQQAYQQARESFRYFWREVSWENRRIVPALDMAAVKAPFFDERPRKKGSSQPEAEQMWLDEIDFDGVEVSGVLINSPNWIKSVEEGDSVQCPLEGITDWLYAIDGIAYGGFTVNLIRSRMGRRELREHDEAWGLDFGDPSSVRIVPVFGDDNKPKGSSARKPAAADPDAEHPMSEAMASSLKKQLKAEPSYLTSADDNGLTLLHQQALAGSYATVKVLLEAGADPNAVTNRGLTPLALGESLGWVKVVELLRGRVR